LRKNYIPKKVKHFLFRKSFYILVAKKSYGVPASVQWVILITQAIYPINNTPTPPAIAITTAGWGSSHKRTTKQARAMPATLKSRRAVLLILTAAKMIRARIAERRPIRKPFT